MSSNKNMDIKFDINCFTPEFQQYLFKKINVENYYEFINSYNNSFSLSISHINQSSFINLLPIEENCSFENIDNDLCISEEIQDNVEEEIKKITYEDNTLENTKTSTESEPESEEEENEEEMETSNLPNFSYIIESEKIHLKSEKKFITKKIAKKFRRNNGFWNKKKNEWIFPLSAKKFIDSIIPKTTTSNSTPNHIQDVKQEENRVVITPTSSHPKYGTSVIYDKSGNIGIWDSNIKGWIFNKI